VENQESPGAPSVEAAVRRHALVRRTREADARFTIVLSDPEVQRISEAIREEEPRLGALLSEAYQPLVERWERASREGDIEILSGICPGKHGRHGRICLLNAGHDDRGPHWGLTAEGQPVAWVGTAPDDD
jgi:hypothetical protein